MANRSEVGTTNVDRGANPPLGVVILAAALAVAGLYPLLVLFSAGGSLATNVARGAPFETALTGVVCLGLALLIAGFYATLYGLWTGARRGWYGTLALLLVPLCFEAVRVLGFALGIGPITFLLESRVNVPVVAGALVAIGYLYVRRGRYLARSTRVGPRS